MSPFHLLTLFLALIIALSLPPKCMSQGGGGGGGGFLNRTTVATSYGSVRGKAVTTAAGNTANVFLGVPYASAPVGPLRFRRPVPPANWTGVKLTTDYAPACPSNTSKTTSPQSVIDEDCLYLNVFTSNRCGLRGPLGLLQWTSLCPVIYYVHGGGYNFDTPRMFPVETLVDNFASNGVVMVTVGYRLGTLGFWRTPDMQLVDADNQTIGGDGNYALAG